MSKKRVCILFGGRSAEHEVSLQSAKNIVDALDREHWDVLLVGIDKTGRWHAYDEMNYLKYADDPAKIRLVPDGEPVSVRPGAGPDCLVNADGASLGPVDVVFPVLHGPFGEDGTVQGLLKTGGLPFVGAGVLGSAVGMDKDVMKRLMRDAGLPISRYVSVLKQGLDRTDYEAVVKELGSPVFIKPANMGSSVGVHKVSSAAAFKPALEDAFRYDHKLIIEECIEGREIECAVLGNDQPKAAAPGEVLPAHDFYSYEAKYIDEEGARLAVPADLPLHIVSEIQNLAVKTFIALECRGLARVDFFLTPDDEIVINEINTLPGFTRISMYPKMWEHDKLAYGELIDELLRLALEEGARTDSIETSFKA